MMIHLSMTQASDEFINQKALSSAALAFAQNLTHVVESTDVNFTPELRKTVNKFLRKCNKQKNSFNASCSDGDH